MISREFLAIAWLASLLVLAPKAFSEGEGIPIYIPEGTGMFGFCFKESSVCASRPDREKYSGMKGVLSPESPVKREYGYDVYRLKMENGATLHVSTKGGSPFSSKSLMKLSDHEGKLRLEGRPIVPGSPVIVEKVTQESIGSYKYTITGGVELWEDEFGPAKSVLSSIPPSLHKLLASALDELDVQYDDMEDRLFITLDSSYKRENSAYSPLQPYIGHQPGQTWLRLKLYYRAESWLFANSALVKVGDTKERMEALNFSRDNSSGTVWEWHDKVASEGDIALLREIADFGGAKVRFYGSQYYADRSVTTEQAQAIDTVLELYDLLNE